MEMPDGLIRLNEICGEGVKCAVAHEAVALMKEMAEALEKMRSEPTHRADTFRINPIADAALKKFKEWK